MKENITLEATGDFPFKFYIEKAIPEETEKELIIEGIASTTNVDHDNERMSANALKDMAQIINEKSVPLRVEHSKDDTAIIGSVNKAWVDDRNQLHVRAVLDKTHMVGPLLHSSMKQGAKMGLSVGGVVKRATKEFVESVGKMVKTFYDVVLNEVSVTPRPANYDSWLVAKHIVDKEEDAEGFRKSTLHDEFLFQNPQLDYLQVFAKSIPDKEWHKINNINKDNNMNKDDKDKKDETAETKSVSQKEFDAFKAVITKGFDTIGKALAKAMGNEPKETTNPDKTKVDEEEQQTAKAGENAKDTTNPDKKKPEDESSTAKAEDKDDETKEKAEASETESEEKKKASDKTEDYKLETVERAIKSIEDLTAKMTKTEETETDEKKKAMDETEDEKKEKAEDKEDETETMKGMHPLDKYVLTVTKALEAMANKLEKSGKSMPGFEKSIVDLIKNDPETQEEIKKMMKVPGRKQSVSMGVPYMVTKEGKRYSLTATEVGTTIEKSRDVKGKTFKDVYKTEYSSLKSEE